MTSQQIAKEFLSLPVTALPSARFTDAGDSWAHDAWETLRECARTGEPCISLCGTTIVVSADRGDWQHIEVG